MAARHSDRHQLLYRGPGALCHLRTDRCHQQARPGADQLVGHLDGGWWLCPGLWPQRLRSGSECSEEYSLWRLLAPAHPPAVRSHLLPAVQLHLQLGYRSPADAYPRSGMLGHGRQVGCHRRYPHRTHRRGHRSIVSHGAAHLYPTECAGLCHQPGAAERHVEDGTRHGYSEHAVWIYLIIYLQPHSSFNQ